MACGLLISIRFHHSALIQVVPIRNSQRVTFDWATSSVRSCLVPTCYYLTKATVIMAFKQQWWSLCDYNAGHYSIEPISLQDCQLFENVIAAFLLFPYNWRKRCRRMCFRTQLIQSSFSIVQLCPVKSTGKYSPSAANEGSTYTKQSSLIIYL